jgi:hypothetical protein
MIAFHRFATALAVGALFAVDAHANLLVNPGAETGTLAGWIAGGDAVAPHIDSGTFDPGIDPHTGNYDFLGGTGLLFTLTQNVSISSITDPTTATVTFWQQGLNQGPTSDNSHITLDFLGASNSVISSVSTAVVDSHNGTWTEGGGTFAIPAGTTSIDYTMVFNREVGSDLDSFVDDDNLTVSSVPEPASGALVLAGLALLSRFARRQRGTH